jgi:hypothetical protein
MTQDEIITMARQAGWSKEYLEFGDERLERFAALVLANNPPQSSMAWQEGYEAGRQAERERLQAFMRQMIDSYSLASDSNFIQARGQA